MRSRFELNEVRQFYGRAKPAATAQARPAAVPMPAGRPRSFRPAPAVFADGAAVRGVAEELGLIS